jgi:hypothetical protein
LGLDEGTALAILLRQALSRHDAVKPQRMLTREVKPTRRPQPPTPSHFSWGPTYRTAVRGTRLYGGGEGRTGDCPPYPDCNRLGLLDCPETRGGHCARGMRVSGIGMQLRCFFVG